jgi:FKBP-type peptidyl-prolyl cis-trans isomerase SlyD
MPDEDKKVRDDMVVGVEYTLRLDDGDVIDQSAGRGPLHFLQGHGQIVPGLEKELYGMAIGEEKQVVVAPEEGYGQRKDGAIQEFPKDAFPQDAEIEPGMAVQLVDQSGRTHVAFVEEIRDDSVLLDLNHPLAGETLHFDVKVVTLREATKEELEHGHVH